MPLLQRSFEPQALESPLFAGCSGRERRELSRLGMPIQVDKATTVISEGRPGSEFFVIVQGQASCTVRSAPRAQFRAGDFFGEMALLDFGPRTATVTADTPMELWVYSTSEFRQLLHCSRHARRHLLHVLAGRLRSADAIAGRAPLTGVHSNEIPP